jgi:hypothetical protein
MRIAFPVSWKSLQVYKIQRLGEYIRMYVIIPDYLLAKIHNPSAVPNYLMKKLLIFSKFKTVSVGLPSGA